MTSPSPATHAVHPALQSALDKKGYETLTPVQSAVIDDALAGRDMLVSAQTGSGKTVAFGLAMADSLMGEADRLPHANSPLALIIAPTRELALQVKRELDWLYADAGAKTASCVGGMDMRDERRALSRGAHIVVGTPGRLCDHLKRGSLDLSDARVTVLDEADEMLKMGFREELDMILNAAPEERRTLLFSATVPKSIMGMAKKYTRDSVRVNTAAESKQHLDITYRALTVAPSDTENAIINILRYYDAKNAIVFGDTRVAVNRMVSRFNNRGFKVVALSGELSQKDRSSALQAMRDGRAKVCIATDVAARGLDLPDLELVIHAALPKNSEILLHRSGRTGRAGRKGTSIMIVGKNKFRSANRLLDGAKLKAEWGTPPSAEDVMVKDAERLMNDPILTADISEQDLSTAQNLLEKFTPEQVAAAFARQYREARSAPEELMDVDTPDYKSRDRDGGKGNRREKREPREPRSRSDFDDGVWYQINVGRKQNAEPRWILPMLCTSGGLKKNEIGAIKISQGVTFFQIAGSGVERFTSAIGDSGKIEKAITATRIDGKPDFSAEDSRPEFKPRDKAAYPSKKKGPPKARSPHKKDKFAGQGKYDGKRKGKKSGGKTDKPDWDPAAEDQRGPKAERKTDGGKPKSKRPPSNTSFKGKSDGGSQFKRKPRKKS